MGMERREWAEMTVLCLIEREGEYLLQDRVKKDWKGYTLPGGHVEPGESIVDAVVREMQEETGLTVENPRLCGVKQFPIEGGRYLVFLFRASRFRGELRSSEEGQMHWVKREALGTVNLVEDFDALLRVMLDENLSEFQYVVEGEDWNVVLK
jgi:8-oxo-dGTP diphosphatase